MFCINCGNKGPATAKFCQECRTAVVQPTPTAPPSASSLSHAKTEAAPEGAVAVLERPTFQSESMPPPPPAATKRKPWGLIVCVVIFGLIVLGGVGAALSNSQPSGSEAAIGATAPLSAKDGSLIEGLGAHTTRWNATVAPVIRDYNDQSVNAADWLNATSPTIEELRGIADAFEADVLLISDSGVKSVFQEISDNYTDKFNGIVDLYNAVREDDADAQHKALGEIQSAAAKGQELASNILDKLRPFVNEADLNNMLQEKAATLQEQMK